MKKATVTWKVYGYPGKDLDETFEDSFRYDFSEPGDIRIIECDNFDKTGTHVYAIVRITRNTLQECYSEFYGQVTDGAFENYDVAGWNVIHEKAPKRQFDLTI